MTNSHTTNFHPGDQVEFSRLRMREELQRGNKYDCPPRATVVKVMKSGLVKIHISNHNVSIHPDDIKHV